MRAPARNKRRFRSYQRQRAGGRGDREADALRRRAAGDPSLISRTAQLDRLSRSKAGVHRASGRTNRFSLQLCRPGPIGRWPDRLRRCRRPCRDLAESDSTQWVRRRRRAPATSPSRRRLAIESGFERGRGRQAVGPSPPGRPMRPTDRHDSCSSLEAKLVPLRSLARPPRQLRRSSCISGSDGSPKQDGRRDPLGAEVCT